MTNLSRFYIGSWQLFVLRIQHILSFIVLTFDRTKLVYRLYIVHCTVFACFVLCKTTGVVFFYLNKYTKTWLDVVYRDDVWPDCLWCVYAGHRIKCPFFYIRFCDWDIFLPLMVCHINIDEHSIMKITIAIDMFDMVIGNVCVFFFCRFSYSSRQIPSHHITLLLNFLSANLYYIQTFDCAYIWLFSESLSVNMMNIFE